MKNHSQLEELRHPDATFISNFYGRFPEKFELNEYPKCTLGHLKTKLVEWGMLSVEEWEHFLKSARELSDQPADPFETKDEAVIYFPSQIRAIIQGLKNRSACVARGREMLIWKEWDGHSICL